MPAPRVSVIYPAYNEASSIRRTLDLAYEFFAGQGYPYEIVVAADGDDGTREIARALGEERGHMKVLGSPGRHGKGHGVREGVSAAEGEIVGFVDADNKTPIEELAKVLPWFDRGYDMVIGSRAVADAVLEKKQPRYRQIGSKIFHTTMHLATGLWEITDTQCGFKFFRAPVARDLFARQQVDGYMFDVEILMLAQQSGYRIQQVGVRWADDGDSRLDLVAGTWRNMVDLTRISLRTRLLGGSRRASARTRAS
jgi:dolichyl-phosphate beta-glucosyltransferase